VLLSMSTPATSHVSPSFIPIFGEAIELLRKIFLTAKGQPFVVSGSGTLGWDMVSSNLIEPNEDVLVLNTVTQVKAEIGDRPTLEEIHNALVSKRFKAITITHVDTSTGVLSDVKAIADLVKQYSPETLVIVDGVCSVGSEEIRVDEWGIDVVLTASQKALGVPPGLCILIASERAMVPKNREVSANGMTAVYYPEGIKATDLLPRVAECGVVIAG
ncbi:3962_t:CDS:2, partial [Racocetra fulgida]